MVTVPNKLIVLDVVEGNFDRGFPVVLRIGHVGKSHSVEFRGRLPPALEFPKLYERWQTAYYAWGATHRWWRVVRMDFPPQITNVSQWDDCTQAAQALQQGLKQWFDQPDLRDLREQILIEVRRSDRARLVIQTHDPWLRRLPWHFWSLLERLPQLEIALSTQHAAASRRLGNPVKILAVLGNSEGIDIQVDPSLLERLPHAKVVRLVEPTRQALSDRLSEQHWDILFFAGHSRSEVSGETGYIWINKTDRLTPNELKFALTRAVENGLQLAIFNSCDGLGLGRELAALQIPHLVVMREPVPDAIAQAFLKYFLTAFSQGDSLCLAVRRAREQLHSLEATYPCASWLPVLCQNPAAPVLLYPRHSFRRLTLLAAAGTIALIGGSLLLQRWWQEWQISARISSGDKVLVASVTNADKIAGTEAFKRGDFSHAAKLFAHALQQQRNDPETLIYLNNAQIGAHRSLKLAVSVPIGSNTNVAQEILRGVAQAQAAINHQDGIKGQLLQVEIANDDNNPEVTQAIAHRLVKDAQILAVVGHNASDASVVAAPIYTQGGLVMVTPTSFSDQLSSKGTYIFRMVPSIRFLADKLASDYITTHPHARIAICSDTTAVDNESYRNQFTNGLLAQVMAHSGAALVPFSCDFSARNFDPNLAIANLIDRGANTLLLAPHVDRIYQAIDMARANHGRLNLLGSPTLDTAITLELGQSDVNGLLLATPWYPNLLPNNPFPHDAAKLWGGPVNWRTAMAYDATQAIAAGLQSALAAGVQSMPTREGLKDALRSSDFSINGASGSIRFIQSGERQIVSGFGVLVQVKPMPGSQFGYDFVPLLSGQQVSSSSSSRQYAKP